MSAAEEMPGPWRIGPHGAPTPIARADEEHALREKLAACEAECAELRSSRDALASQVRELMDERRGIQIAADKVRAALAQEGRP